MKHHVGFETSPFKVGVGGMLVKEHVYTIVAGWGERGVSLTFIEKVRGVGLMFS